MSAFVELLRKSNLDCLVTRKTVKIGTQTDEMIFASLIDGKSKTLQVVACLDKSDGVTIWLTSLDERSFQLNARLLDLKELSEMMSFLGDRLKDSDFTASKTNADDQNGISLVNITFTHPKTKQSITLKLSEHNNADEKASILSKILLHLFQQNEQLTSEVKNQQIRLNDFINKRSGGATASDGKNSSNRNDSKDHLNKIQERTQRSLINPAAKRRKAAMGVNYDEDDSD